MTTSTLVACDPVCGKNVPEGSSTYLTSYRGQTFRFCSGPCLLRFEIRPEFYFAHSGARIPKPILKQHRLLMAEVDSQSIEQGSRAIGAMPGVTSVHCDANGLVVEYDLRRTTLQEIEAIGRDAGLIFREGLHGYRRRWWKFTEGNELDNALRPSDGACCNRPPR